jgi:hypothetical protein
VASTIMALDFMTCGEIRKGVAAIRDAMGQPSGATTTKQQEEALRFFALSPQRIATLDKQELVPPRVQRLICVDFELARTALDHGRGLIIAISYKVVNLRRPDLSGDTFKGPHSIFVDAVREKPGKGAEWRVYDPLYHDGPRWWPEWLVRRAAARMKVLDGVPVGLGRILCVKVTRPLPRHDHASPEDGVDDATPQMGPAHDKPDAPTGSLVDQVAALQRTVDDLRRQLAVLDAEDDDGPDDAPGAVPPASELGIENGVGDEVWIPA